jgi:hypothetical protein
MATTTLTESTRRERKWRRVGITFLAPALALFFIGFLIFQSEILRPGGIWLQKPDTGNVITKNRITLTLSAYSYTFLPLDRIVVTYWHEGINLRACFNHVVTKYIRVILISLN